jgi:hypothetical protein
MAITVTNRKVLTVTSDQIDNGGLTPTESIEIRKMQKRCREHMNNTAPSFFQSAVSYGGNPIYNDLILEHNVPAGQNRTDFEAEADAFYDANYTFDDLNAITLTTDKIPYVGADTLLSEFITFSDA